MLATAKEQSKKLMLKKTTDLEVGVGVGLASSKKASPSSQAVASTTTATPTTDFETSPPSDASVVDAVGSLALSVPVHALSNADGTLVYAVGSDRPATKKGVGMWWVEKILWPFYGLCAIVVSVAALVIGTISKTAAPCQDVATFLFVVGIWAITSLVLLLLLYFWQGYIERASHKAWREKKNKTMKEKRAKGPPMCTCLLFLIWSCFFVVGCVLILGLPSYAVYGATLLDNEMMQATCLDVFGSAVAVMVVAWCPVLPLLWLMILKFVMLGFCSHKTTRTHL